MRGLREIRVAAKVTVCRFNIYSHVTCVLAYIHSLPFCVLYLFNTLHTHMHTHPYTQTLAFVSRHVRSIAVFSLSLLLPILRHFCPMMLCNCCPLLLALLLLPPFQHQNEPHGRNTEQYGFVNYALELLVLKNFGPVAWEQIK